MKQKGQRACINAFKRASSITNKQNRISFKSIDKRQYEEKLKKKILLRLLIMIY
jgi:hypothetical protein